MSEIQEKSPGQNGGTGAPARVRSADVACVQGGESREESTRANPELAQPAVKRARVTKLSVARFQAGKLGSSRNNGTVDSNAMPEEMKNPNLSGRGGGKCITKK